MNRFFTRKIHKWPINQISVFGEMQIKTKMRCNYTSTNMAKIRKIENPYCYLECGETGTLILCWKCKSVHPSWKKIWQFFTQLNLYLPYDPVIPFLGIYHKEVKAHVHKRICIRVFIETASTDETII